MANLKSIIDMYIESEQEVRIMLVFHHPATIDPMLRGKIIARGDDYIELQGEKDFPPMMLIPIYKILAIIPKEKKAGK